ACFYAHDTENTQDRTLSLADLSAHNEGLIALSGGIDGALVQPLQQGQAKMASKRTQTLHEIFADRFYIEVQRHGLLHEDAVQEDLLQIALDGNIAVVATNHCCFLEEKGFEAHDTLICVGEGRYVSEEDRAKSHPNFYLRTPEEMTDLFADIPEAITNSIVIAKRCAYTPEPIAPLLPTYTKLQVGANAIKTLHDMAHCGLKTRLQDRDGEFPTYEERLHYELNMIEQTGFAGYFLIVADFIQWAKQNDIPVGPGRGSGAGSVVAWSLTITDIDPLKFGLLFERFLNPERVSMPDFDIDFCQDRRDEVIAYVQREYGVERVAQIITHGTLQARAVLRDVGRVLQLPHIEVDRICKMIPNNPAAPVTLAQAIEGEQQIQDKRDEDPNIAKLLDIGMQLEGLYRHASTHAANFASHETNQDF
ncbi:MAG: DNA polymerase III subunit alpha, partial [Pseudomonadota bacterium]